MIVSHRYRFIFIKTRKTAGTSVEISLSRYCGPEDILTPLHPPEDEASRRSVGRRPQNWSRAFRDWTKRQILRYLLTGKRPTAFWNHIPALEIRARIGEDVWQSYFKFCFERDPWDKTISYYQHKGIQKYHSFDDFIQRGEFGQANWPLYTIDGEIVVDRVCRYENLSQDLGAVADKLGIPFDGWLPRAKAGYRDPSFVRDQLTKEQIQLIGARLAEEVRLLGYEAPMRVERSTSSTAG